MSEWVEEVERVVEAAALPELLARERPWSLWWAKSFRLHSQYLFPIWH